MLVDSGRALNDHLRTIHIFRRAGAAVVSSFILTAEEGFTLRQGEEIGYFQFGGSNVVVMFESKRKIKIDALVGEHYKMGVQMGSVQDMS